MNIEQLKAELLRVRKTGDSIAKAVLQSLIAEYVQKSEKNKVDITSMIRKYIDNAQTNAVIESDRGNGPQAFKYVDEAAYLESLLPEQLGEGDLLAILMDSGITNIGEFMKLLRSEFSGQYDGKVASKVFRENI